MKDDAVYLRHIWECIRRIEEDVAGGREEFFTSHMVQDAVLRNLQTLAEATQRLSDTAKAKHPEMEWGPIAALRNVLVHNYLGIDLEAIWGIVQRDLPQLKRVIAITLAESRK
jgi:uncharacterized protein with HEPN domain